MSPTVQRRKDARVLRSGWLAIPVGIAVASAGATVIALVVAGFILGGYLDAGAATSIPALDWLSRLPPPLRITMSSSSGFQLPLAWLCMQSASYSSF